MAPSFALSFSLRHKVCLVGALSLSIACGKSQELEQIQGPIQEAKASVVALRVGSYRDSQFTVEGLGSGTLISKDGWVLTNYHLLIDSVSKRVYDKFYLRLNSMTKSGSEFFCSGTPQMGYFRPELDLALIRCTQSPSGQALSTNQAWNFLPLADSASELEPGKRIWILGYPDGGEKLFVRAGQLVALESEQGPRDKERHEAIRYWKSDAQISPGFSGGAVVDDNGHLVGVATAYRRTWLKQEGGRVPGSRVALIQPVSLANDLVQEVTVH